MNHLEKMFALNHRTLIELQGPDKETFLQGLLTQDVRKIEEGKALYATLLTPQGKFLHDLFLIAKGDSWFIDCERERVADLLKRLNIYKLRSKVVLLDRSHDFQVLVSLADSTELSCFLNVTDPRHADLGNRLYVEKNTHIPPLDTFEIYDEHRIRLCIPDGSRDLPIERAVILEYGFESLGALDWNKGCYMGQELMARTHYRGLIRKKLICVDFKESPPAFGEDITLQDGTEGKMCSSCGHIGLVLIKTT